MMIRAFAWFHKKNRKSWLWKSLQPSYLVSSSKSQDVSVAVDSRGLPIGYVASSNTIYGVAYISTAAVDIRHQNRGIGKILLMRKLSELRRKRIRKVWLLVTHTNLKALAFYLKNGFVIEGYLRDHTGPGSDEILLSRFLEI